MRETGQRKFTTFATEHATGLMRLAGALTGDIHFSEDAAQTALERVYARWSRVDDPLAYARQIVVNLCRDRGRGWSARETVGLPPDTAHAPASDGTGAVDDRDRLVREVRALPDAQRAAVVLRYWQDLSEAETAATLGISVGAVKSNTSRALRHLRTAFAQHSDQPVLVPGGTRDQQ